MLQRLTNRNLCGNLHVILLMFSNISLYTSQVAHQAGASLVAVVENECFVFMAGRFYSGDWSRHLCMGRKEINSE